jgi:hypothetical protein
LKIEDGGSYLLELGLWLLRMTSSRKQGPLPYDYKKVTFTSRLYELGRLTKRNASFPKPQMRTQPANTLSLKFSTKSQAEPGRTLDLWKL